MLPLQQNARINTFNYVDAFRTTVSKYILHWAALLKGFHNVNHITDVQFIIQKNPNWNLYLGCYHVSYRDRNRQLQLILLFYLSNSN